MKRYAFLIFLSLLLLCKPAFCNPLQVAYIEYPPYYFTNVNEQADGFLLNLADQIFRKAGANPVFTSVPAKRILKKIQLGKTPLASIGWFKTEERKQFAKFSYPIYINKPVVLVCLKTNYGIIGKYKTFKDVLADDTLIFGRIQGYSDGDIVDAMIDESSAQTLQIVGTQKMLMRMLEAERISYILLAPEEVEAVAESADVDFNLLSQLSMKDIPFGSKRYIMCSRAVSDETVEKLNHAIIKIVGEIPD